MKKFYVEVKIEDVEDLADIVVDDFEGSLTVKLPAYGQYCTRVVEVELPETVLKEFYEELKLRGIRNYKKEVA